MSFDFVKLIKFAQKSDSAFCSNICEAIIKHSYDNEAKELSSTILNQCIEVDLNVIKSLVEPDGFEFEDQDIGGINVEKDS